MKRLGCDARGERSKFCGIIGGSPGIAAGGGLVIGNSVTNGTANSVLYTDSSGNLANDSGLTYASSVLTAPMLSLGAAWSTGTGITRGANANQIDITAVTPTIRVIQGELNLVGNGTLIWGDQTNTWSGNVASVNINRAATNKLRIGSGGSNNAEGSLQLAGLEVYNGTAAKVAVSGTAPTISAGFCTSPTVTSNNGTAQFVITIGTSCAAATGTVTMPAASNAWTCYVANVTSPASNVPEQTGGTTTTVTVTNYARTTGLAANWTDSEVLRFMCLGG